MRDPGWDKLRSAAQRRPFLDRVRVTHLSSRFIGRELLRELPQGRGDLRSQRGERDEVIAAVPLDLHPGSAPYALAAYS
jgi:hypothetical protein